MLISAEHNQGIDELINVTMPLLPENSEDEVQELKGIAVAILGRPNVGKININQSHSWRGKSSCD